MKPLVHRLRSSQLLLASALVLRPYTVVLGEQVYDDAYCNQNDFYDAPLRMLDRLDACDNVVSPQCQCALRDGDYDTYASCYDQNVQCSALNPAVCGHQSALTLVIAHQDVYVWQYTSGGRNEKLTWTYDRDPNTCTFEIEDSAGSKTYCTCEMTDCNRAGPASYFRVDCSNYQSGAIADACYDGLGIATGSVLEGLAVTVGGGCVGGSGPLSTPSGSVPAPSPSGPVPTASRPVSQPVRAPTTPPTEVAPNSSTSAATATAAGVATGAAAVMAATALAVGGAVGW